MNPYMRRRGRRNEAEPARSDEYFAIEQSLLAFFPEERPVYEGEDGTATRRSHCMRAMYMPPGSRH